MAEADDQLVERALSRVGNGVGGKYRLDTLLGIGGMATVYAATHRNGHRVAIKFLHPEYSVRSDIRARFRREAQAANAVKHPGAVAVIDDDVDADGSAYLVMELLEGEVVESLWARHGGKLPVATVLAIARDLCDVLAAAHRAGIVHRDLKPENLFLTREGRLKVLDFGLAQLRDSTRPKDTHTGMVFGTPAFMPPEQASGRTSLIDERSDLWAVGATMFTLLSGATVHEGETAQHIVVLSATEPARSLSTVLPDAPPELALLVDRALTWDKQLRWSDATAMREAIRATSLALFGESDVAVTQTRAEEPSDELTHVKPLPGEIDDLLESTDHDRTRVDATALANDSSAPPTEPRRFLRPADPSDTPAEDPTQPRLAKPAASQPRVAANWSDLRHAIEEPPTVGDHTQLLSTKDPRVQFQDETAPLRPPMDSTHRLSLPSRPVLAVPQERVSRPAPLPQAPPRAAVQNRRNAPTVVQAPQRSYLPVVIAAALVGLTPLGFFFARDCGGDSAALREPRAVQPGRSPLFVPPATLASTAPTMSTVPAPQAPPKRCATPLYVDDAGVMRVKPECFDGPTHDRF